MNESEALLSSLLGLGRAQLYLRRREKLGAQRGQRLAAVLRRRIDGEPLEYILGEADFLGSAFAVTPAVLIPRPETELLVESAAQIARRSYGGQRLRILEIGTGSGCIAVMLAKLLPGAAVTALDICAEALAIARRNARAHGVSVQFLQSDLCARLNAAAGTFDIVVSNPPYIRSSDLAGLQREVRREPLRALDGGADGLSVYRRLIPQAAELLSNGGSLLLEIGADQAPAVRRLMREPGVLRHCRIQKDLAGRPRIAIARKRYG